MRNHLFLVLLMMVGTSALAQDRCGTVPDTERLKLLKRIPADDRIFENWLQEKIRAQRSERNQRQQTGPYKVPVVVHVIHNGEAVGVGTNISDAQVISQINVLNKDFKRLNADASSTPAEFQSVAGSMDIEFILARQDPEGLATNGITRTQGTKTGWTNADSYELKALSYWPAEDYLNIWVCDLVDELVGTAQLPESNLPGLENTSANRLTDGLVIWYRAFGSIQDGPFNLSSTFSRGRTATHEMGHFFGLRHIWGDDGSSCSGDDYVADTPNQAGSSTGCPTHPKTTCSAVNMFQNYMDYTSDPCMNLFTQGQVARMNAVIENSPRRVSLLTSRGLNDPGVFTVDMGIREIITPADLSCSSTIVPSIEVRNYGTNTVTSAVIRLSINGILIENKNATLNMNNLQSQVVTFDPVDVGFGESSFVFEIIQVNGVADQNSANDLATTSTAVPSTIATPFSEDFNTMPSGWIIQNPDGLVTWQLATAPRETSTNKAMSVPFFSYQESYGEVDVLMTPVFDLSTVPVAALMFDVAYTRYLSSNDVLKVVAIRDCEPLENGLTVYEKFGSALRTTNSVSDGFTPTGISQWRKEFINISQLIGESHLQLAFVSISDWGNNLYLDNVSVLTSELEDVSLQSLISPGLVTCVLDGPVSIHVQNVGTKEIQSLTVEYSVNGGAVQSYSVTGLTLALGEDVVVVLPESMLTEGDNSIQITLVNPNGVADQTPWNNAGTFKVIVDSNTDRIPLRQNFDEGLGNWLTINPQDGMNWETTETNYNTSIFFNAHNNTVVGDAAWLISPVLDFSTTTTASVVFDVASATRLGRFESLAVLGSTDCGNTFQQIRAVNLEPLSQETAFAPGDEAEWQNDVIVPLNTLAGSENVRVAFVVTNANGNNLFIDNIEFFKTDNPNLIQIDDEVSIYGYNLETPTQTSLQITFNLAERSDVVFSIVDLMGKTLVQGTIPDVLNQTYPLEASNLSNGVYVVRLKIGEEFRSSRILINR